jgi:hypothetical protein
MRDPARVRVAGPLEHFRDGFAAELSRQGYTPNSTALELGLMAHVSRWLAAQEREVAALDRAAVDAFLAARRAAGYTSFITRRAMVPLVEYLRGLGAVPAATAREPGTPVEVLLERYGRYLTIERGLAAGTVSARQSPPICATGDRRARRAARCSCASRRRTAR